MRYLDQKRAKGALQTRESKESSCNAGPEPATGPGTPEQLPQDHLHLTPHLVLAPHRCGPTQLRRKQHKQTATASAHHSRLLVHIPPPHNQGSFSRVFTGSKTRAHHYAVAIPTANQSLLFQLKRGILPSQYVSSFHRVLEQQVEPGPATAPLPKTDPKSM